MSINSARIFEKVSRVPYLSSPETENFLFILKGDCFLKKKEIELSIKNSPPDRATTPMVTIGTGVALLAAIVAAVLTFIGGSSWLIVVLVVTSVVSIILFNVKDELAKDAYDLRFRKKSWFTFYETNFRKMHVSYFLPLYKNSSEFKELSNVLVNKKELETLLVVAETFEGTFEELVETAKALEAS